MRAVLRRVRAYSGHLALLAALTLTGALLVAGVPRLANHYTDTGLAADVERLPGESRDLVFSASTPRLDTFPAADGDWFTGELGRDLPAPLAGLVEQGWFQADVNAPGAAVSGPAPYAGACRPSLRVRYQTGALDAVTIVEGRAPASRAGGTLAEAVVSRESARLAGLKPGTTLTLTGAAAAGETSTLRVTGIYEATDPAAPAWQGTTPERLACPVADQGTTWRATLLTDLAGPEAAGRETLLLAYQWRYRIRAQALRAPAVEPLTSALVQARVAASPRDLQLRSGLQAELEAFDEELSGARGTVAVVQAGLIATVLGLIVLAALLMAGRRQAERGLIRARGGSTTRTAGRILAEATVVGVPALAAGWGAAQLLPGRPGTSEVPLLAGVLLVALGAPVLLAARTPGGSRIGRLRRLTAEAFVVLLAVLGVVLTRQRGPQTGDDPFLSVVPVLLGAAAALLVVRLAPAPLRQAGRIAARGRGLVAFLGLARAGRGSPVAAGPVAVLIVAAATGIFATAVSTTVATGRDEVTDRVVGADAQLTGYAFQPGSERALAAVPGVDAAAPLLAYSGAQVNNEAGRRADGAQLLVLDGAATADVMRRSGVSRSLPGVLSAPRAGGPVPVVVSPDVAADVGASGLVVVQGRRYDFRVAAVADSLPGLEAGTRRFVAVGWQTLPHPADQPLIPTGFLIAGEGYDPAAVIEAGNAAQREYYLGVLRRTVDGDATEVTDEQLPRPATIETWRQYRDGLQQSGVNGLLSFIFLAGAAGSAVLALLAVGLAVLAGAPDRGRALSRLRTLGLSGRQGRNLLILELAPLLTVAFLAGALVGWGLPLLLGPALGLSALTAGLGTGVVVGPWLPVFAFGLLAVGVAGAVAVEETAHRRMGLGQSLRLGEES